MFGLGACLGALADFPFGACLCFLAPWTVCWLGACIVFCWTWAALSVGAIIGDRPWAPPPCVGGLEVPAVLAFASGVSASLENALQYEKLLEASQLQHELLKIMKHLTAAIDENVVTNYVRQWLRKHVNVDIWASNPQPLLLLALCC